MYFGLAYFVGQEVVFHWGQAVWSMSYAGGVMPPSRDGLDPRTVYGFLRLALRHGNEAEPYRGPATFSNESWSYTNSSGGRLDAFWGLEETLHRGEQVYSCRYAGGVLR